MKLIIAWKSKIGISTFAIMTLMALLFSGAAMAAFTNDYPLTYNSLPVNGSSMNQRMTWNPVSGNIGMAYVDSDSATFHYLEWTPGTGVTLNDDIGVSGYVALGLSYDGSGNPYTGWIGFTTETRYLQYVKSGGTWTGTDTGVSPGYYYSLATYARNPSTGTGAFYGNTHLDTIPLSSYIDYSGGVWRTTDYGDGGAAGGYLAFTSAGVPYAVWGDDVAYSREAGKVTPGSASYSTISTSPVWQYYSQKKIAINPTNGEIWVAYIDGDGHLYIRQRLTSSWDVPVLVDGTSSMNGGGNAQLGFAIAPNGDKAIMYPTTAEGRTDSLGVAFWDHLTSTWTVESIEQKGDVTGIDLIFSPTNVLYGLYNSSSNYQWHILSVYQKPLPLYLKVTMNNQTTPVVLHGYGFGNGGATQAYNVWQDGFHMSEYGFTPSDLMLSGNETTGWMDLTPLALPSYGNTTLQFYAITTWNVAVTSAEFTIQLSNTPSDTGIFKTFTRSGSGSGMTFVVDMSKQSLASDDLGWSTANYNAANALPAYPGSRPVNYPLTTSDQLTTMFGGQQVFRAATVTNDINTLTALGFDGVGTYDIGSTYYNAGFTNLSWGTNYSYAPYISSTYRCSANVSEIGNLMTTEVAAANAMGHTDRIRWWSFADEPGSVPIDHIVSDGTYCIPRFRTWLQQLGLTPQDFGQTVWSSVNPSNDPVGQPKLYYYTGLFRGQVLVDFFKIGTDDLKTMFSPTVPTTANLSDEVTFSGNPFASGVDQFALFDSGSLQFGWTESWLGYAATYQEVGIEADLMRGAVGSNGSGQFGMYNPDRTIQRGVTQVAWDTAAVKLASIGHGATQIYDYAYGPFWSIAVDACDIDYLWYQGLKQSNYAIGAVENNLIGATMPKSKIALLYSQSTDIWDLSHSNSITGRDRNGLSMLLRHLGYPVDIISEKQVAGGILTTGGYKMLVCTADHLLKTALLPLQNWVNAGGVLYLGPGALEYDETNTDLGFDAWAGIDRASYYYLEDPGSEANSYSFLTDQMPVTYSTNSLKSLCGYQKMNSTPTGATVLATFTGDGTASCWTKTMGTGKIEWSGFHQGIAYVQAGMITKIARDTANPNFPTWGSTDWPQANRDLFTSLLTSVSFTDRVTTNNYLVEADRLESPSTYPASMILVTNWTGATVNGLQVAIPQNGKLGAATTVINSITNQTVASGVRTVTFNMAGPIEIIKLPPSGNAPTVSITAPAAGTTIGTNYNITATAADSGGTISNVKFYQGSTLLGTDSSSPYSYSWTACPGGDFVLSAVATDNTGNTTTSAPVKVTLWKTADIGTVGQAGSASYNAGTTTFTVAGAGAGITGTSDAFRFVYQQTTENCTITARVATWTDSTYANSRAGVMMRQSTTKNVVEASSLFYSSAAAKNVYFHYRTAAGGATTTVSATAAAAPYWVRVNRVGNTIKSYMSADGLSWTQVNALAGTTVTMTNPILIGLAVTSGTTTATKTATFDNVSITRP